MPATHPSRFLSTSPGAVALAYVHVQMTSKMTRSRLSKLKIAVCTETPGQRARDSLACASKLTMLLALFGSDSSRCPYDANAEKTAKVNRATFFVRLYAPISLV